MDAQVSITSLNNHFGVRLMKKTVNTGISMPEPLMEKYKQIAAESNMHFSDLCRQALASHCDQLRIKAARIAALESQTQASKELETA
jgi:hypothetical protein